jgi:hypothetical protein
MRKRNEDRKTNGNKLRMEESEQIIGRNKERRLI